MPESASSNAARKARPPRQQTPGLLVSFGGGMGACAISASIAQQCLFDSPPVKLQARVCLMFGSPVVICAG